MNNQNKSHLYSPVRLITATIPQDEENQIHDELLVRAKQISAPPMELEPMELESTLVVSPSQPNTLQARTNHQEETMPFDWSFFFCFYGCGLSMVGGFIWCMVVISQHANKQLEKEREKQRIYDHAIHCYNLELNNFTEDLLEFTRPRGGYHCSISPWREIAPNATMGITKSTYNTHKNKCQFFTSTGIQISTTVDGYDDDAYKHDTLSSTGKDNNNCWIEVKKQSDCSWGLFKKCPSPTKDLISEYHLLPKP